MEIFAIVISIVLFSMFVNWFEAKALEGQVKAIIESPAVKCPPHKWSHHPETHRLTCITCQYVAGSEPTNKEPY